MVEESQGENSAILKTVVKLILVLEHPGPKLNNLNLLRY